MLFRALAASVALMLCNTSASGQQSAPPAGFYLGADVGQAKLAGNTSDLGSTIRPRDDASTSYEILIGYRFSKYFALETGYADLGNFTAEVAVICLPVLPAPDCTYDVDTTINGAFVNAIGALPLGEHVYLSATLGAFYHSAETTAAIGSNAPAHTKDSGTVAQFGVGVGFPINEHFDITVDWLRRQKIDISMSSGPTPNTYDGEFSVISAGARFFF